MYPSLVNIILRIFHIIFSINTINLYKKFIINKKVCTLLKLSIVPTFRTLNSIYFIWYLMSTKRLDINHYVLNAYIQEIETRTKNCHFNNSNKKKTHKIERRQGRKIDALRMARMHSSMPNTNIHTHIKWSHDTFDCSMISECLLFNIDFIFQIDNCKYETNLFRKKNRFAHHYIVF